MVAPACVRLGASVPCARVQLVRKLSTCAVAGECSALFSASVCSRDFTVGTAAPRRFEPLSRRTAAQEGLATRARALRAFHEQGLPARRAALAARAPR